MTDAADRMIAEIDELGPQIAARAAEIETLRTVPRDLIDRLREIGVFRMLVPRIYGGLEFGIPDLVRVISAIAAADGSVGWTVMIGSATPLLFSRLPKSSFEEIYAHGPDVIHAGSSQPIGTAEIVPGGYRVTGRWPFASGSPHADWILGVCMPTKDGAPVLQDNGQPKPVLVTLPASAWTIEDTWYVSGLRGSGSHHISIKDAFVPEDKAWGFDGPSCLEGRFYYASQAAIPFFHAALAIGIAEGAFADILALAGTGKKQFLTPIRELPLFQYELGRAEGDLRAAQAYLATAAEARQASLDDGTDDPATMLPPPSVLMMGAWVTEAAARVVDYCYTLGGGSALYDTSPLQRRLRDIRAATQHGVPSRGHYIRAGAHTAGVPQEFGPRKSP